MVIIKSLRRAIGHLTDYPVLFVPFAAYAVLQIPQLFLEMLDPIVGAVASLGFSLVLLFITPAVYAGALGMVNDADRGRPTSLDRFVGHAKTYYLSVLGAYLFVTAVTIGFAILIAIAAIAVFAILFAGGAGPAAMLVGGGAVLLLVLAMLIVLFALHFCAHAIVVEDVGAVSGLSRSVEVVRSNLLPVGLYAVLSTIAGAVVGGLYSLLILLAFPTATEPGQPAPAPDLVPALVASVGSVVFLTLFGALFAAFTVVFYRELTDAAERERSEAGSVASPDEGPTSSTTGDGDHAGEFSGTA